MGEYARQYIFDRFGIDIGEDDSPANSRSKKYGCVCGKVFLSYAARAEHQRATGHDKSKKQRQEEQAKGL